MLSMVALVLLGAVWCRGLPGAGAVLSFWYAREARKARIGSGCGLVGWDYLVLL